MAYLYNMKKILISLVCLLWAHLALAQKDSLQLDENNKYVYYRVVEKPGTTADTLYKRAIVFASKFNSPTKPVKGKADNTLNTSGKVLLYTGSSLMKKEGGEVTYTINIQTKDNKYRYRISNFVFTPYQRDRFGNMVPIPGIEIPLDKVQANYNKKDSDDYLNQVGAFCINASVKLVQVMENLSLIKKESHIKTVSTDNW
jgi:ribosomal protein S3AE